MQPAYMHPDIIYLDANATFGTDGILLPNSFVYNRRYAIDKALEVSLLSKESAGLLFPPPPRVPPNLIFQYKVVVGGQLRHLYFELWPESGTECLGRWFVVRKGQET